MFKRLLFPTDFSEGAIKALERFERVNETEVGEVILLHVIEEETVENMMDGYILFYEEMNTEIKQIETLLKENARKKLEALVDSVRRMMKAKEVKTMVRIGVPYEEIVKAAREENVSVILMPSHGKSGYSEEIFGSTTIRVLKKTRKAVMVIKTHPGDD